MKSDRVRDIFNQMPDGKEVVFMDGKNGFKIIDGITTMGDQVVLICSPDIRHD